ncbi:uncharacterized protein (DUF302 family) [Ancylobacter sp. 3268]|uniref:DUF302 domain-containing protein n=1 Tax=Ancylobacter sp. 3268 TaxID=2817752 RepID=UPI0028662AE9|nr:DUF302 domain-containing protein [Ancylobacter sp. 3268]MDR6950662.1 uncharacterized protein (DUF302 family) [Ancylobacter sp. 3268]
MLRKAGKNFAALAFIFSFSVVAASAGDGNGVVKVRSAYSVEETVVRVKQDVAAKGIPFFAEIDQSGLANAAGIALQPSRLLIFGNPPLGAQFLTSNPNAGLDWPVRLLVRQDADGSVVVAYSDFAWIADRYGIRDRQEQFETAASVISSVTSSVTSK